MIDLKEFLEKSMNFGLGFAAYSRDKIEELVEEMVKRGEVAQKDARGLAADLVKKGEEQRDDLKKLVADEVAAVFDKMDLARKSDISEQVAAALKDAGLSTPAKGKAAKTEPEG